MQDYLCGVNNLQTEPDVKVIRFVGWVLAVRAKTRSDQKVPE